MGSSGLVVNATTNLAGLSPDDLHITVRPVSPVNYHTSGAAFGAIGTFLYSAWSAGREAISENRITRSVIDVFQPI